MEALRKNNYAEKNSDIYNNGSMQDMARALFESAIRHANGKHTEEAMELAQEALVYSNMTQSYLKPNIHRFMAMLNYEAGKLSNARLHCWNGIQSLQLKSRNFFEEKDYFEKMLEMIEDEMKKVDVTAPRFRRKHAA